MNKEGWWATVHGVTKSQIPLSNKHKNTQSEMRKELGSPGQRAFMKVRYQAPTGPV